MLYVLVLTEKECFMGKWPPNGYVFQPKWSINSFLVSWTPLGTTILYLYYLKILSDFNDLLGIFSLNWELCAGYLLPILYMWDRTFLHSLYQPIGTLLNVFKNIFYITKLTINEYVTKFHKGGVIYWL